MSRIWPALESCDQVIFRSKKINNLSFPFITPLQTKYYVNHIFIFWRQASQLQLNISCDAPFIYRISIELFAYSRRGKNKVRGKTSGNNSEVICSFFPQILNQLKNYTLLIRPTQSSFIL